MEKTQGALPNIYELENCGRSKEPDNLSHFEETNQWGGQPDVLQIPYNQSK